MSARQARAPQAAALLFAAVALAGAALPACAQGALQSTNASLAARQRDQNTVNRVRAGPSVDERAREDDSSRLFLLGVAFDRDQTGRSVSTPFLFNYVKSNWDLSFGGAGYLRTTTGNERGSGLADVFGVVSRKFLATDSAWALEPSFQLVIPTRGEVGSRRISEAIGLAATYSPSRSSSWAWIGEGSVAHNHEPAVGVSRYTTAVSGKVVYSWTAEYSAFMQVERAYTRGDGGTTTVTAEYDFPIGKTFGGSLIFFQGLTPGKRSKGIEFDLSVAF